MDDSDKPDETAVRVALWRALHVEVDPPPHVLEDLVGLQLAAPGRAWRRRGDMNPRSTRHHRAAIVARARFVEDLVAESADHGVAQYVVLGAGLDSFVQRRPELAARLRIFEVDRAGAQAWKRRRLVEQGYGIAPALSFVAADFETADAWWSGLIDAGFDAARPAVVASLGVSMYLPRDAIVTTLRRAARLAPGSTFVMSFMLPIELAASEARPGLRQAAAGARSRGTPFISFFTPDEALELAKAEGFELAQHVSANDLTLRYFRDRQDQLRPADNVEELLVAATQRSVAQAPTGAPPPPSLWAT